MVLRIFFVPLESFAFWLSNLEGPIAFTVAARGRCLLHYGLALELYWWKENINPYDPRVVVCGTPNKWHLALLLHI